MEDPALTTLHWREIWEDGLDAEQRARITRSVRRCQVLPSADEAVIAAEMARQWMRRLRTMMVVNVVLGAVLGALLLALVPPSTERPLTYWVTLCLPVVLLATPLLGWWQLRRLSKSRTANLPLRQEGRA